MRRYIGRILVGSSLIAAFATGFAITLVVRSPSEVDAAALAQRAQAQSGALANQLLPGKVIYGKTEVYQRHGPAAAEIAARPDAQPERFYGEGWSLIDQDGYVSEVRSVQKDTDGNVIQTGWSSNSELVFKFTKGETEYRIPFVPYSDQAWAHGLAGFIDGLPDKGFQKAGGGLWDGKETAVFEIKHEYQKLQLEQYGPNASGYRIPYTEDLEPQYVLERIELVVENPLINRSQRWAVDAQGSKTLIYETVTVMLEVIDSPQSFY
jgi:hypothetical protein